LFTEGGAVAAGFEDALGDKEETGSGFEGLNGGLVSDVGEEAEGYGDVAKGASTIAVAEDG